MIHARPYSPSDKPLWDDLSPLVVQVRLVPVK